ncbi:hypothetical protein E4T47_08653 [Aureobasidium subglaciale]|nr:hypothetical protein E4T47_08653 [Aureobasidium subglaciale]
MASQTQDMQALAQAAREQFAKAQEIDERCRQRFIYEYDQAQAAAKCDVDTYVATQQDVGRSTVYDDEDDQTAVASDDADDERDRDESTNGYDEEVGADSEQDAENDDNEADDNQPQHEVEGEDDDLEQIIAPYADDDNQSISSEHSSQKSDTWSIISGSTAHSTTVRVAPRLLSTPELDAQPLLADPCDTCDEESGEDSENESYQDSDDYDEESYCGCTEEGVRADQAEEDLAICIEECAEEASRADFAEKQLAICIEEARVVDNVAKQIQKDLTDTNESLRTQYKQFGVAVGDVVKDFTTKHNECMRLKDAAEKLYVEAVKKHDDSEARYARLEAQYNECMLARTAAEEAVEERNRDVQVWEQAHALEHEKVNLANNKLKWVNEQLEECLTDRITLVDEKETSISEKEILLQTVDKLEHQKNEAAAKWSEENEALKYSSALSNNHYQRQIEDLKESHDQQIALVQDTIEALTSEHEDEFNRVEREYTAENEDLKECYEANVNKIAGLEKQNKAFRMEADHLRGQTQDTATLQAELKASKIDIDNLKVQLVGHEESKELLEQVTQHRISCVKQIERLQAEILSRETERKGYETMVQMVKNARLDKSKTEDWCTELKTQLETVIQDRTDLQQRLKSDRGDLQQEFTDQMRTLNAEFQALRIQHDNLRQDEDTISIKLDKMTSHNKQLQKISNAAQFDCDNALKSVERLEAEQSILIGGLKCTRNDLATTTTALRKAEEERSNALRKLSVFKEEQLRLNENFQVTNDALSTAIENEKKANDQRDSALNNLNQVTNDNTYFMVQIRESKHELQTAVNASKGYRDQYEKLQAARTQDQKKLQTLTEEREKLLERNNEIRKEFKAAMDAGEALEDELEAFKEMMGQESDDQKKMAVFNHIFPTVRDISGDQFQQDLMELQNSGAIDIETLKTYLCSLISQAEEEL